MTPAGNRKSTELPADGKGFDSDTRWQEGREERIVVERREMIAEIEEGDGEHPMLRLAFMTVSDAIASTIERGESQRYEFTHRGHTFEIVASPAE